jgi:hypothetical protein
VHEETLCEGGFVQHQLDFNYLRQGNTKQGEITWDSKETRKRETELQRADSRRIVAVLSHHPQTQVASPHSPQIAARKVAQPAAVLRRVGN